jgi:hypothetical protein
VVLQLAKWAEYGTIEPSAAEAISAVVDHHEWVSLSDKVSGWQGVDTLFLLQEVESR